MCNNLIFISYILVVITMKKRFSMLVTILLIIVLVVMNITIKNKNLVDKISIFITSLIALSIAYLAGFSRGKNGLVIGLIIGISVSCVSLVFYYLFAKEYFDSLYIRLLTFLISGMCGGVIGVNKKTV